MIELKAAPGKLLYRYRNGTLDETDALSAPDGTDVSMWREFDSREAAMSYHGLPGGEITEPFTPTNYRYSKLKVRQELITLGIWDSLKTALTADQYEEMLIADDFAFDNENFVAMYNSIKTAIPDIDEILKRCTK